MELPASLPARMYLLAYDTGAGKLTARNVLGFVLRAAALADLYLQGALLDAGGKPQATATANPATDPVLGELLQEIAQGRARSWTHWASHGGRTSWRAVEGQLEDRRLIRGGAVPHPGHLPGPPDRGMGAAPGAAAA